MTVICVDCMACINVFHLVRRWVDVLISVYKGTYCSFPLVPIQPDHHCKFGMKVMVFIWWQWRFSGGIMTD